LARWAVSLRGRLLAFPRALPVGWVNGCPFGANNMHKHVDLAGWRSRVWQTGPSGLSTLSLLVPCPRLPWACEALGHAHGKRGHGTRLVKSRWTDH
jgi:hypothetical protein